MATVNLRFRGGPRDGEIATMDVQDVNEPPESYGLTLHGPHETVERIEYRRIERGPDGQGGIVTWIYELSPVTA